MWILLLSIPIALLAAFVVHKFSRTSTSDAPGEEIREVPVDCCGAHEICEKDEITGNNSGKPVYFNDEELDQYCGKGPDQYTLSEEEQFREVLFTMQPAETQEWLKSLMMRGIKPPQQVRQEALNIIKEHRQTSVSQVS